MNSLFNLLVLVAFLLFTRLALGQTTTPSFTGNITSTSSEEPASQTSQTLQITTPPADPAAACSWARSELSSCSAKQSALTTTTYIDQSSCLCSNITTIYGSSSALFDAQVSNCATYLLSASYTLYPAWTGLVGFCTTRLREEVPVPPEITIPYTTTSILTSASATTGRGPTTTAKPPPNAGGSNSITSVVNYRGATKCRQDLKNPNPLRSECNEGKQARQSTLDVELENLPDKNEARRETYRFHPHEPALETIIRCSRFGGTHPTMNTIAYSESSLQWRANPFQKQRLNN
ncbi:hypothetical protein BGZ60DRAFT_542316 [Tricladium varicosporioides]|nr:hypothetical protein BGZ60DRAFT_542316 [Hymenoscyphus varicosporioides]